MAIFIDYNATTPASDEAKQTWLGVSDQPANPGSLHHYGRQARKHIEATNNAIHKTLAVPHDYIILYTASGTEANNLLINSAINFTPIVSSIEHQALLSPAKLNPYLQLINVNSDGIIDLNHLEDLLKTHKQQRPLISLMMANNETGAIQPLAEAANLTHRYGGIIHSDMAQTVGKLPINVAKIGLDAISISAHKFYGVPGAAALIYRPGLTIEPQIMGGGQQFGKRAGTENVAAIAAMGTALNNVDELLQDANRQRLMRDHLESSLLAAFPGLTIVSRQADRLANTSCIVFNGMLNKALLTKLDLKHIAASTGAACSSGKVERSHVLEAMAFNQSQCDSAVRFSLGINNTSDEINLVIDIIEELYETIYNNLNTVEES